jgi:glycolate oxidase
VTFGAEVLSALRAGLPPGALITDPDLMAAHRRDESDLTPDAMPACVVHAASTADVVHVLRVAAAHRVPVVPQGARTGLAGGANASAGCIALSLLGMDRILELNPVDRLAVVQAGVLNSAVSAAAAPHGLRYPPDPGSVEISTIGGNAATDAGGMCCVKYGVTSNYVLGLEVVLANGDVLRTGRRTSKGVAGYDLTHLFVGSEGTLGVITEVTLGLRPVAEPGLTLAAVFDTTAAAGAAVAGIGAAGCTPSLLEILDRVHLRAIEDYRPMDLPTHAAALLLAAVDTGDRAEDDLKTIADLCRGAGAREVHVASDAAEAAMLLQARRLAHPAMEQLGALIIDDIAVPRSRLAELLDGIEKISVDHGVPIGVVGHAGDGNMHPNIVVPRDDPDAHRRGRAAFEDILALGLALGGTVTGEHGIGLLKREWLEHEAGPIGIRVQRSIKDALDPLGILNPGKVFEPATRFLE